jgi:hypothetical protein
MEGFDHILNWRLQRGSHGFPGKDGGTCINEAALVACGFPYRPVRTVTDMPHDFSRPICRLALRLNDEATNAERQRLMPFVTRLACADRPEVERERAAYISARIDLDDLLSLNVPFEKGLRVLEGALAIGRQADPLGFDEVESRMDAAQQQSGNGYRRQAGFLPAKLRSWFGRTKKAESVE